MTEVPVSLLDAEYAPTESTTTAPYSRVRHPLMVQRAAVALLALVVTSIAGVWSTPVATAAISSLAAHPAGCAANAGTYPGSRKTDCVALSDDSVVVDHTVVNAKWSLTSDIFGFTNLCAAVTIRNQNKSTYFFNDINMTLRPPTGSVTVLNFTAKHALEDGFIAPGGVARGNICFDYFGQAGQYVAMYSPHALSAIRGIWLVNVA